MSKNKGDHSKKYCEQITNLDEQIMVRQNERNEIEKELQQYQQQFAYGQQKMTTISRLIKRLIKFCRSIVAYLVGRRNIKHLYSRSFKTKNASNQLKANKYYLYNLGFIDRSLNDLQEKLTKTDDKYLKRAINWELGLWYANQQTKRSAQHSFYYIQAAIKGEKVQDRLRRAAILQGENLAQVNQFELGKEIIKNMLTKKKHPDLYFAMANLEETLEKRLIWMNKVMNHYQLQEITFLKINETTTYDDLRTKPISNKVHKGPKVSVLLPAYNAERGIQTAIESILEQTWTNIELIIVDDCSTDNTVSVVSQYMKKDERIKLFSTPENSGPYVARNIGLQHATGEFITVNDADDWSHAQKIEIQVQHLINNHEIIANTSEHARLTEDLKLYRRGTPGSYIFSNMSSLMFRRQPVLEKIGYWDSVRFAADGEFKRRLIKEFGEDKVVDLRTGPLSLPRQSNSSLTASSAFGYSGYFMGARKEYVANFSDYHKKADTLYYPYPMPGRLFPVPEPMWPVREAKRSGGRHMDIVVAADFQIEKQLQLSTKKEINVHKKLGIRTGIVQKSCYNMHRPKELGPMFRKVVNGEDVQTLVYGEHITCDVLIIKGHSVLQEKQLYLPNIKPRMVAVVIDDHRHNFRQCSHRLMEYYGTRGIWYARDLQSYQQLTKNHQRDLRYINLAMQSWQETNYEILLEDWLTEENPYT